MGCVCPCLKPDKEEPTFAKPLISVNEPLQTEAESPKPIVSVTLSDFNIEKLLGKGAFGKVLLVTKKDTGQLYAMKSLRKEQIEERNQKAHTRTEREILGEVNCPFIVQLRFAFQTADKLYMVMDFINGGELFFHLRRCTKFPEDRTRFYSAEILTALEYLHKQGIIYRDLKPENVLLDSEGHIKLTDFGLSKKFFSGEKKTFSFCGTPEYLAPEILKGIGHDQSVDFWSFGALIYEMLSGAPPFYCKNKDTMFRNMLSKPVEMKIHFSPQVVDLLRNLLQVEPKRRLQNINEIKKHPFFESIDWEKLNKKMVDPPFKPSVSGPKDLRYFDKMFTEESALDSVPDKTLNSVQKEANKYVDFTYRDPSQL